MMPTGLWTAVLKPPVWIFAPEVTIFGKEGGAEQTLKCQCQRMLMLANASSVRKLYPKFTLTVKLIEIRIFVVNEKQQRLVQTNEANAEVP